MGCKIDTIKANIPPKNITENNVYLKIKAKDVLTTYIISTDNVNNQAIILKLLKAALMNWLPT